MSISPAKSLKKIFLVSMMLVAAGVSPIAAQAATSMKIGTVVWIGYGPFFVADAKKLFEKHDLDVSLKMFTDPALIPTAIASNSVDGGMLTYDQVIGSDAKGLALKVVMPIDYSNGGDAIVATKDITKISQFKGKKIGFNTLSPSDFLLAYAMKQNGLSEKDIEAIPMTPEAVPAAMISGSMPVGVTYEPSLSQILSMGGGKKFHVVFSSREAPGLIADVLVFDQKFIDAHPKEIKGLIESYVDGMAYMKAHPKESADIIGKAMGITGKEVMDQMTGVYNIPLAEMPKAFVKSASTTSYYASGEVISGILKNKGQITTVPATETTIDSQFVKSLVK
jgi:NitT/TauT family transport system substrate-binding protein